MVIDRLTIPEQMWRLCAWPVAKAQTDYTPTLSYELGINKHRARCYCDYVGIVRVSEHLELFNLKMQKTHHRNARYFASIVRAGRFLWSIWKHPYNAPRT